MNRTSKEFIRHTLHLFGWRRKLDHLRFDDRRSRFEYIYGTGVWTHGDASIPGSGHGSSLEATMGVRSALPEVLRSLGSRTLLDVGCGDFTWMGSIDLPCAYIGADIVPSLIERQSRDFGSSTRSFVVADAVLDPLPDADTVLCREVLFHLSFKDALAVLRNIVSKPRTNVILTTDRTTAFNADIVSGDFRALNLEKRPFKLSRPDIELRDDGVSSQRVLGVWKAADIRKAVS